MFQIISNALYIIPAIDAWRKKMWFLSVALALLSISSGVYHYSEWHGEVSKWWQYADVSMIYIVLALFPASFMRDPKWMILLLPVALLVANKFNVLMPDWNPSSSIIVPVLLLPTLVIGYFKIRTENLYSAIILFVFAVIFSHIGDMFGFTEVGYSVPHGWWHAVSAIAFAVLINGIKDNDERFEALLREGRLLSDLENKKR